MKQKVRYVDQGLYVYSSVDPRPPGREGCLTCPALPDPAAEYFPAAGSFLLQLCSSIHNSDYIYITPALVFVSLYQLAFTSIIWLYLSAITLAKSTIFFLVLLVGLFVHFYIILLGFVAGKFSLISDFEAHGLDTFVDTFYPLHPSFSDSPQPSPAFDTLQKDNLSRKVKLCLLHQEST